MKGSVLALSALVLFAGCGKKPAAAKPELSVVPYAGGKLGAVQVMGGTADWYVVSRGGKPLPGNPPLLNATLELEPGEYEVSVNRTVRTVAIEAGKKAVLLTGSLVVEGSGGSTWYPMQGEERRVATNPPTLGKALALFAGQYSVYLYSFPRTEKLAESVAVSPGGRTALPGR